MTDIIEYVSRNFACDRETRERGEDWKSAETIDSLLRNLALGVELARWSAQSQDYKDALRDMEVALSNLRVDCCWPQTMARLKQAFADAKVVPMRRSPKLTLVTP